MQAGVPDRLELVCAGGAEGRVTVRGEEKKAGLGREED